MTVHETRKTSANGRAAVEIDRNAVVLTAAAVLVTVLLCVNPAPNNDLFWQLRTGAAIVHGGHAPRVDAYSWTRTGTPWVAHEWLTFITMWLSYAAGGYVGVWLWMAAMIAVAFAGLYRLTVRRTGSATHGAVVAFALWLTAVTMARPFFQPRPQVVTYALLVLTIWLIHSARQAEDPRARKRLWLLPPMFAIWANFHAGVLIALGIAAVYAIGDAVRSWRTQDPELRAVARTMMAVVAIGAVGTLATPYGIREYADFAATIMNSTAMNMVGEWGSPDFHQTFGHAVEAFLGIAIVSLGFSTRSKDLVEIGILLVLVHEALGANRNVPLLAIVGTPLIAPHAASAVERVKSVRLESTRLAAILASGAVAVAATIAVEALAGSPISTRSIPRKIALTTIDFASYPSQACEFIRRERFPRGMRLYNIYGQGGFLIWSLPDHPVFVDGRADIYFGNVLSETSRMRTLPYQWRKTLDARGVDLSVWDASDPQAQLFLGAPEWALVYADDLDIQRDGQPVAHGLIFVRRLPRYSGLIAQCRRDCPRFDNARHAFKEDPALR